MRAAAHLPVAIIAIGAYLMIAATFVFSPAWIALGVLAIAVTTAVAIVKVDPRTSLPARSGPSSRRFVLD